MTVGYCGVPWTEEDYLALGQTPDRIELFDGGLVVTPAPTPWHQHVSRRLANVLDSAADSMGLTVFEAVNVRLRPGRVPIPDLVIANVDDFEELVINAPLVRLIGEIVSPSNAGMDRLLKMHYYAEAGIPWYLLVDREPELTLRLYRLEGGRYAQEAVGRPGQPLRLVDPVKVEIDPTDLLPGR